MTRRDCDKNAPLDSVENVENVKNVKIENVKNVKIENVKNVENVENVKNVENVENVENVKNVENNPSQRAKVKLDTATKRLYWRSIYDNYNDDERGYYDDLPRSQRRKISETEAYIAYSNDIHMPLRFKVLLSELDEHTKALVMRKLKQCDEDGNGEDRKLLNWVEMLCTLPINKYVKLPICSEDPVSKINSFMTGVSTKLDAVVHGHAECKGSIKRLICQWIVNPESKGLVIGIQGPAGVGKTSLVKDGICEALGLPFAFIPLGGASDGSFLEGHSYTYEGSVPGRMVDVVVRAKCMNPVLFFDETDKISETHRGQEVSNILIHLTDPVQNMKFNDRYFRDIDFDFSRCLMIFSFNDMSKINPILLDRMSLIHVQGYSTADKKKIASGHLVPEILKEFKMSPAMIVIPDDVLNYIIQVTEEEEGVRNLKRSLQCIVSNINMSRILDEKVITEERPWTVEKDHVDKYLSKKSIQSHNMMYV